MKSGSVNSRALQQVGRKVLHSPVADLLSIVYYAGEMHGNFLLQGISRWLTPESLPGWIAALIMAAALIYQWYRGRPRPSRIVVFEANRTLFGKLEEAKSRLSMAFNGQEIESLALIDLAVRNEGASTIENIDFTIEVNEQARILAIQPQPAPRVTIDYLESDPSEWEVTVDYLNPLSLDKERVRLAVFCEPEPVTIQVRGGGKGWSLEFLGEEELHARKRKRIRALGVMLGMEMVVYFIFTYWFVNLGWIDFVLARLFPGGGLDPGKEELAYFLISVLIFAPLFLIMGKTLNIMGGVSTFSPD